MATFNIIRKSGHCKSTNGNYTLFSFDNLFRGKKSNDFMDLSDMRNFIGEIRVYTSNTGLNSHYEVFPTIADAEKYVHSEIISYLVDLFGIAAESVQLNYIDKKARNK